MSIDLTFNLSLDDLKRIVEVGLSGGVGYWARISQMSSKGCVCTKWAEVPFTDDPTAHLYLYDEQTGLILARQLSLENLKNGFEIFIKDSKESLGLQNCLHRLINGHYDSDDADVVIQYALFGEVIYG
jgi:hypothetical protein